MSASMERLAPWARLATLTAWAAFLFFAWTSGRLVLIHPAYRWLTPAAATLLTCIAVAQAAAVARGPNKGHAHEHADGCSCAAARGSDVAFMAVSLAPILISLAIGRGGLSGASIMRRGVRMAEAPPASPRAATEAPPAGEGDAADSDASSPDTPEDFAGPPFTIEDIHRQLTSGGERLEGARARVVGQFYRDERCGPGEFIVMRVIVTCCLADADIMGLMVRTVRPYTPAPMKPSGAAPDPPWRNEQGADQMMMAMRDFGRWVEVSGRLVRSTDRAGRGVLAIEGAKVVEVAPPDSVFIYPRVESFW